MKNKNEGFTLLEILIALFIFTILSILMAQGLRTVINANASVQHNAERLRQMQMALLILSRDIEQAIDRPVINASGKEEMAFLGEPKQFIFTHVGVANSDGLHHQSSLQRTKYYVDQHTLWRATYRALDAAPDTAPHIRQLLPNIDEASFQYLDDAGKFYDQWPVEGGSAQSLPRAVRLHLSISQWGQINQLYVIHANPSKTPLQLPKS